MSLCGKAGLAIIAAQTFHFTKSCLSLLLYKMPFNMTLSG